MKVFNIVFLAVFIPAFAVSQEEGRASWSSIPEELLRPARGEAPRYPVDTVIGELGQGNVSSSAFAYANSAASALFTGRADHPAFSSVSASVRESYISALGAVNPQSYRIGGGREEADGAVSFMVRFIGREYGITGELFIRYVTIQIQDDNDEVKTVGSWVFEDLILEEAKERESQRQEPKGRFDFSPYERFF
jgi:hypothetical protein